MAAGIGADEGGYAYIAREWARGGHLYKSLWVDRPQGLMLSYRWLLDIADRPWAIRLGAVLAGVAVTLLIGAVGWLLRSRATGLVAASLYALVGVGPHIEGFTFNGETAAAVPAVAAVAAGLGWVRTRRRGFLVAAGLLGGLGPVMKQSGIDGLLVACALAAVVGAAEVRARLGRVGLVLLGAAVPIGAALIHGVTIAGGDYGHALLTWRTSGGLDSAAGHRPGALVSSVWHVAPDLAVLWAVAIGGLVVCVKRRGALLLAPAWLAAALVGFNLGGLYWPHYYLQLLPPTVLLAAIAVTAVRRRELAAALCVAAVASVAFTLVRWAVLPTKEQTRSVKYLKTYRRDVQIASFLRRNTTRRDTIYAFPSEPDLYYLADRRSAERYLWSHPLREIPGALPGLWRILSGPNRPKFVIVYSPPSVIDPSGHVPAILARDYTVRWRVTHRAITVFQARPPGARPRPVRG